MALSPQSAKSQKALLAVQLSVTGLVIRDWTETWSDWALLYLLCQTPEEKTPKTEDLEDPISMDSMDLRERPLKMIDPTGLAYTDPTGLSIYDPKSGTYIWENGDNYTGSEAPDKGFWVSQDNGVGKDPTWVKVMSEKEYQEHVNEKAEFGNKSEEKLKAAHVEVHGEISKFGAEVEVLAVGASIDDTILDLGFVKITGGASTLKASAREAISLDGIALGGEAKLLDWSIDIHIGSLQLGTTLTIGGVGLQINAEKKNSKLDLSLGASLGLGLEIRAGYNDE